MGYNIPCSIVFLKKGEFKGKLIKMEISKTARKIVPILGIGIDGTEPVEVLNRAWGFLSTNSEANSRLKKNKARLIVTPNPEIVSRAQSDHELAGILNKADIALPDGVGIVAAAWFLHGKKLNRLPGRLLALDLIKLCAQNNKKVLLLGGKPGSAEKAVNNIVSNLKFKISNLKFRSGPWLDDNGEPVDDAQRQLEKETIKEINQFKPDLLLVGFGAPKQEKWLDKNLKNLNIGLAMVVGGMIDYTAGILTPAPGPISAVGLEWLWRLIFEPTRFGRILTATIVFPWQVLLWKLKMKP